jgi:CRP-like cAMP-binding protein
LEPVFAKGPPIMQFEKTVGARRPVFRAGEPVDHVPVVCEGWAAIVEYLPNGRRQILGFTVPGEFITASLVFSTSLSHDVEAVTPVLYRNFDRAALRETLAKSPDLVERLVASSIAEKERADELIIDLGRRRAEQRVARLILQAMERMARNNQVVDNSFNFPLRQTHIADALGLTAAYVNQVLTSFRQDRLINIENRALTVLDLSRLRLLVEQ